MVRPLNIAFVHPDLGIGGAERLVVDAAISLQKRGHRVAIYTMHHDISHCFAETRDGTLDVRVGGNWLVPRSIGGRLYILCTILRSLMLARQVANDAEKYDALFVDQLSAPIPLLKYTGAHIFFYCHFPDYLLARRDSLWQKLYRAPFDLLEEFTTGEADEIVVNSRFTQETFRMAFPHLGKIPKVLTPALNFETYDRPVDNDDPLLRALRTQKHIVLSINRFERKKDIALALKAFALCLNEKSKRIAANTCLLVLAGGWDPRVVENTQYLNELDAQAKQLGLCTRTIAPSRASKEARSLLPEGTISAPTVFDDDDDDGDDDASKAEQMALVDVLFLPSFSENQRAFLLSVARCVVYTPTNEHLGIVPLESMYMRVPVVAVNSGGPRETIQHGVTGYLCEPTADEFAAAISKLLSMKDDRWQAMGDAGHDRVKITFGLDSFGAKLEQLIVGMLQRPTRASVVLGVLMTLFIICTVGLTLLLTWWL
ncbi:Alpha-1,3-mannosyltransferase-like protein [Coemansia aciculifera]|uniref:Alpha-1,3-mannosyltransferase-like protein n=1 Tax=Coemansia aciculifera TaxID=417176 RepID=A0ACC1M7P6_9FUNG|nr:Alpha-1,3-mannosyltransferase-like protein [Coemansia aciculifera]